MQEGSGSGALEAAVDEEGARVARLDEVDGDGGDRRLAAARARDHAGAHELRGDLGGLLGERLDLLEHLDRLLAFAHVLDVGGVGVGAGDEHVRQLGRLHGLHRAARHAAVVGEDGGDVALGLGDRVLHGLERLLGRPRVVALLDDDVTWPASMSGCRTL